MKVAVVYASENGNTKKVAHIIGTAFKFQRIKVRVLRVEEVIALDGFDAIILGSAAHNGDWLPSAINFANAHQDALANCPLWFFSNGDMPSVVPKSLDLMLSTLQPRDIVVFGSDTHDDDPRYKTVKEVPHLAVTIIKEIRGKILTVTDSTASSAHS